MRLKYVLPLAVLMASGAVYLLSGKSDPGKPLPAGDLHIAKATRGPITRVLRLTGQTAARDFVNINAPILRGPETSRNLVLMKLVKGGSHVGKGELVARIDSQQTADHVEDVADFVRQAQADIQKRKSEQQIEWETLQQTLRQAKSDYEKAKLDAKTTSLLTDIERELLQLNVEETEARYQQLQKNLQFQKAAFDAEIRILDLTRERQQRHHDRHERDLKDFEIHAPMNGLAVMQPIFRGGEMGQIQEGDMVYPGQLFMKVVNPASMQLEAKTNQAESSELRIGQRVTIGLDAFPGLRFGGRIRSIGALATGGWMQNLYIRNIPVNVTIETSDPKLIPDLSGSADVVIDTAGDVVRIPLSAVHESNGKSTVLVRQGGQFTERQITLGLRNSDLVAVTSGLEQGEEVRLN